MEPNDTDKPEESSTKPKRFRQPVNDFFLQALVESTNHSPALGVDITLLVKGMFVSGTIIAGDEYFKELATSMAREGTPFHESVASRGEEYAQRRSEGTKVSEKIGFIHLKNCNFAGALGFAKYDALWRGRLTEVDGFFIGKLTSPAPSNTAT